jgi:signal transduction histidine kinase
MFMSKSQRHVRNYLLSPLLQIKFGVWNILLSVFFSVIFVLQIVSGFENQISFLVDMTDAREQILEQVESQKYDFYWLLGTYIFGYMIVVISSSILMTHSLIGPTIAFRRHIRALIDGNYKSRVTLRKADAFSEVAEDLNSLAETLEKSR